MKAFVSLVLLFAVLPFQSVARSTSKPERRNNPPKVTHAEVPAYPGIAAVARAFGKVIVNVEIDAEGKVSSAKVSSGHPLLQPATKKAATLWRFESVQGQADIRKVKLILEYLNPEKYKTCKTKPEFVTPYHVKITRCPEEVQPNFR